MCQGLEEKRSLPSAAYGARGNAEWLHPQSGALEAQGGSSAGRVALHCRE